MGREETIVEASERYEMEQSLTPIEKAMFQLAEAIDDPDSNELRWTGEKLSQREHMVYLTAKWMGMESDEAYEWTIDFLERNGNGML